MTEDIGGAPAPLPKQDPETLVLRAPPRPVVRFKRGLIMAVAATTSTALVALAWFALDPPSFSLVAEPGEGSQSFGRADPDALANAPADYAQVPKLGPPLPGDLGRPILAHRRELEEAGTSTDGEGAVDAAERARTAAEAERQRLVAAREAARASGLMVGVHGRNVTGSQTELAGQGGSGAAAPPIGDASGNAGGDRQPSLGLGALVDHTGPAPLGAVPSPWTLSAGTIIPVSLITGLNSDLPGTALAQVTENVRDSATGRAILIPQGSRLIGSYNNVVAFGQSRAFLAWQRIVLPDGTSIEMDNLPTTDPAGYAGVADKVDFHSWRLLKGIGLSTLLGVGTELSFGSGEGDLVRALRESTQQNAARAGDQITSRNLDVKPTIKVRPGWPLRAIVHKDLVLRPWKG